MINVENNTLSWLDYLLIDLPITINFSWIISGNKKLKKIFIVNNYISIFSKYYGFIL